MAQLLLMLLLFVFFSIWDKIWQDCSSCRLNTHRVTLLYFRLDVTVVNEKEASAGIYAVASVSSRSIVH